MTELAERVGIGVDTDREVNAFQCAFHFGHALTVEALPGIDVSQEKTVLGTFWRDTAVEQEEIDFFATGHPLVEALFGFLRDGPYGRTGFRAIQRRVPKRLRGLEVLFHLVPPEPRTPPPGPASPRASCRAFWTPASSEWRWWPGRTGSRWRTPAVLEVLEEDGRALPHDQVRAAFPDLATFVDTGVAEARRAAEDELVLAEGRGARGAGGRAGPHPRAAGARAAAPGAAGRRW